MYRTLRNGAAICLLIAAAVGTWYWSRTTAPAEFEPVPARSAPLGYYLRDAVLLGTDEQGRVVYRVSADLAEERPDDGALLLNGVLVEFQEDEQVPWRVRASRAEAQPEQSYLELEGEVRLESIGGEGRPPTLVETEQLRLEPDDHTAVAEGDVRLTVGENTLSAVGLKAFLKEDRLELESKVHGRFLP
ncbi:MAG: LPS export ABC transporter periplasmic protein LptC [Gammaproteobacteria bacterium]|nr:LPS export ABC transporter periplasmic protein LptC [Gammaproteobacteria bacterium]